MNERTNECFQPNEKLVAFSFEFCVCLKDFCAKKLDLLIEMLELNVQLCFDDFDSDPVRRLPTDTVRYVCRSTGTCRFYNARQSHPTPPLLLGLQLFVRSLTKPAMPRHVETRLRSFVFLAGGESRNSASCRMPQSCDKTRPHDTKSHVTTTRHNKGRAKRSPTASTEATSQHNSFTRPHKSRTSPNDNNGNRRQARKQHVVSERMSIVLPTMDASSPPRRSPGRLPSHYVQPNDYHPKKKLRLCSKPNNNFHVTSM